MDRESGFTPLGTFISLTNPNNNGKTYVTTDGTDPRESGGDVSQTATTFAEPFELTQSLILKSRVLNQSIFGERTWSALTQRSFFTEIPSLQVSEIMYHPAEPSEAEEAAGFTNDDAFEFLEFVNTGTTTINLEGMRFHRRRIAYLCRGYRACSQ